MHGSTVTYRIVSLRRYGYPDMVSSCGVRDGLDRMSSIASSSACLVACFGVWYLALGGFWGGVDVRFVVRWFCCVLLRRFCRLERIRSQLGLLWLPSPLLPELFSGR